jgi:peptidoglycan-N-acetylglucosamine deacetylase
MPSALRTFGVLITALTVHASTTTAQVLQPCAMSGSALGVSRIVEIDTSTGALFGAISTQAREARFLGPKEVVLTFDDGPMPPITRSILDTLDRFCTKATFFSVGKMALAYPSTVKNILERGHTLGTHTWSHPLNLKRLSLDKAKDEIEKGHAAVTLAAGTPIAPFFRFPGLSDNGPMLKHLQRRGIASFTVDVVSNDSYISDADVLIQRTLKEVEDHNGGIMLFHDIKPATARALPKLLAELQRRGYKVVHMRAKASVAPLADMTAKLVPLMAKTPDKQAATPALVPFFGLVKPGALAEAPAVSALAPAPRDRPETTPKPKLTTSDSANARLAAVKSSGTAVRGWVGRTSPNSGSTATTLQPAQRSAPIMSGWGAAISQSR